MSTSLQPLPGPPRTCFLEIPFTRISCTCYPDYYYHPQTLLAHSTLLLHSFPSAMMTSRKRKPSSLTEKLKILTEVDNAKKGSVAFTRGLGLLPWTVSIVRKLRRTCTCVVWRLNTPGLRILTQQIRTSQEGFRNCLTSQGWQSRCLKWLGLTFQGLQHRLLKGKRRSGTRDPGECWKLNIAGVRFRRCLQHGWGRTGRVAQQRSKSMMSPRSEQERRSIRQRLRHRARSIEKAGEQVTLNRARYHVHQDNLR